MADAAFESPVDATTKDTDASENTSDDGSFKFKDDELCLEDEDLPTTVRSLDARKDGLTTISRGTLTEELIISGRIKLQIKMNTTSRKRI